MPEQAPGAAPKKPSAGERRITPFLLTAGLAAGLVAVLGTALVVYAMPRSGGRTEVVTLILTGIAVNAFAGALIGLFVFLAEDTAAVNQIAF